MIVSLHQTLVLKPNMRHPLLSSLCPSLEEALGVPRENPLKDMATSMPFDTIVDMGSHFMCPCDYCQGR